MSFEDKRTIVQFIARFEEDLRVYAKHSEAITNLDAVALRLGTTRAKVEAALAAIKSTLQ